MLSMHVPAGGPTRGCFGLEAKAVHGQAGRVLVGCRVVALPTHPTHKPGCVPAVACMWLHVAGVELGASCELAWFGLLSTKLT